MVSKPALSNLSHPLHLVTTLRTWELGFQFLQCTRALWAAHVPTSSTLGILCSEIWAALWAGGIRCGAAHQHFSPLNTARAAQGSHSLIPPPLKVSHCFLQIWSEGNNSSSVSPVLLLLEEMGAHPQPTKPGEKKKIQQDFNAKTEHFPFCTAWLTW